jgi:hypothetical protein
MEDDVIEENKCLACGLKPDKKEHKFCPLCGNPVLAEPFHRQVPITLHDFDESDRFTNAYGAGTDEVGVLLPNLHGYSFDEDRFESYFHREISDMMVEKLISKFKKDYSETIELLRENADDVQVKFGIVKHYC